MHYRLLGNTGVYVSELCLGAMTFGTQWEAIGTLGQKEANALVHRSLEAGVNFFDTADVYSTARFGGDSRAARWRAAAEVVRDEGARAMGPGGNDAAVAPAHHAAAEASSKAAGDHSSTCLPIHRTMPVATSRKHWRR